MLYRRYVASKVPHSVSLFTLPRWDKSQNVDCKSEGGEAVRRDKDVRTMRDVGRLYQVRGQSIVRVRAFTRLQIFSIAPTHKC